MTLESIRNLLVQFLDSGLEVGMRAGQPVLSTPFCYPTGEIIEVAVEEDREGWRVWDLGTTDGFLAELGVGWHSLTVQRAVDRLCREQGVEVQDGVLLKYCSETTIVSALMSIVNTAQAVSGVAYTPAPRMPATTEDQSRMRIRRKLEAVWERARLTEGMETRVLLQGKSGHKVTVTKVRDRPIVIFDQSLRQDSIRRAQAVTFELLDVLANGLSPDTRGACVYDPPADGSNGKLVEAHDILETYFDAGVFSVANEDRIVRSAQSWMAG